MAKFYLFHENEKVPLKLYQPFDLLVAESPLALFKAANIGIDPSQLLYLPHQIPFSSNEHTSQRPFYKQKLLEKWEKNDSLPLIGMFCRFQYRKNVEYALKVLQRLYDEGASFVFYLKGTFDSSLEGEEAKYTAWLKEYLLTFKEAPWLIWDQKPEPFDEIVKHYAAVDFALQLSGAESASNTIVEEMAVGTPVLVLQCSTNPSLFGDGVDYVKTAGLAPGALPFYIPDEEDLYRKIKECLEKNRFLSDLSKKAIHLSRSRFNHEESVKRFHLLMDLQSAQARKKREELFYADLKEYGFER